MLNRHMRSRFIARMGLMFVFGVAGCNWNGSDTTQQQRDEKTREEAAKAAANLKPALENAGRELGKAAQQASEDARAAAQGVKDGWEQSSRKPIDLNSASERELAELPGVTPREARRIVDGRPYRDKRDVVDRGILPSSTYAKIRDYVTVK